MEEFNLKNDSGKNVRFTGELIGKGGGRWQNGREQNRWTVLKLYRTEKGKFVLHKEYITQWQGESCSDKVSVFSTAQEVYDHLLDEDDQLGRVDKELLEDAAKHDSDFENVLTEEIE
jgi:EXLDI family protein